jgi:hypothetical protein
MGPRTSINLRAIDKRIRIGHRRRIRIDSNSTTDSDGKELRQKTELVTYLSGQKRYRCVGPFRVSQKPTSERGAQPEKFRGTIEL